MVAKIHLSKLSCSAKENYEQSIFQYVLGWSLPSEK